ncbi:hypothetical protein ACOMHN_025231 [Nucella lapillus]
MSDDLLLKQAALSATRGQCFLRMHDQLRQWRPALKAARVSKQTTVAVILLALFLLALLNLPFSFLFSSLHSKDTLKKVAMDINAQRTKAARDYLSHRPKKTPQELEVVSQPGNSTFRFTIAVITVGRQKPGGSKEGVGYVLQSVASVLDMVSSQSAFRDSFVFVCNVDPQPHNHADAVVLKDFLPYAERYGVSTIPGVSSLQVPGTEETYRRTVPKNMFHRELHDYMFCLHVAHQYKSQYYIMIEDDAVPMPGFSDVLELSLSKLTKRQTCLDSSRSLLHRVLPTRLSCLLHHPPYSSGLWPQTERTISPSPKSSFAYLKLYFPQKWQGFAFEPLRLLDLASLGAVGGGLGLMFCAACTIKLKRTFQPSWRPFLQGVAISLVICYMVGRQNINELRRISKYLYRFQASPDCCTPAMLYPAPVVPFLITWLAESPVGAPVDIRIAACFHYYQVPAYHVEPNLVHHVGFVSTLPKGPKVVEEFLSFS